MGFCTVPSIRRCHVMLSHSCQSWCVSGYLYALEPLASSPCACFLCKPLPHKRRMLTARWTEEPGAFNQTELEPKISVFLLFWWLSNCLKRSVMHVLHKSLYSLTQVEISIPQLTNVEWVEAYWPLSPKPYWPEDFQNRKKYLHMNSNFDSQIHQIHGSAFVFVSGRYTLSDHSTPLKGF